jgi:hypothetical protein
VITALAPLRPFEVHFHVTLGGELISLDVAWPWWKAGIEADGWAVRRRSRRKFDRGSHRANVLLLHGWRVLHVTSAMSDEHILGQAARLLPREIGAPILRAISAPA